MPNWRKLIVSGSDASLSNLIVTNSIWASSLTGSLDYQNLTNLPNLISSSAQLELVDSASYALTASFAQGGSGSFFGSFTGDGSNLSNVNVSQVATVSDTFTSTTSKSVNHSFGTKDVIVTVYNDSDQQIIPATVTTTDINNVTVTFDSATTGRIVIAKGGHIVSGSANLLDGQPGSFYLDYNNATNTKFEATITGSLTYNITHNLNEDFPFVQVYDSSKKQVLPGIISASNANTVFLEFDSTFNGTVIIKR